MTNNKHKEIMERFEEVNKKFLHDIENGREDGLYILDTNLFRNFLSSALTEQLEEIESFTKEKWRSYSLSMNTYERETNQEVFNAYENILSYLHSKKEIIKKQ